jgi:hypothetical protein
MTGSAGIRARIFTAMIDLRPEKDAQGRCERSWRKACPTRAAFTPSERAGSLALAFPSGP